MKFKIGDIVVVSSSVMGDGNEYLGVIDDIQLFLNTHFIYVTFNHPTSTGVSGITITNPELLTLYWSYGSH